MLLSFGGNDDGQCGRHPFRTEEEEHGYEQSVDAASSPDSPIRRKASKSLNDLGKIPAEVFFPERVKICVVAAGSRHSLALSTAGHMYSWGWGVQGQLGHGDNKTYMSPKLVGLPESVSGKDNFVVAISAGGMHSACLTKEGECYTWGASNYGQLGVGQEAVEQKTCNRPMQVFVHQGYAADGEVAPKDVPFIAEVISCGGMHTAAVDKAGKLWCWGRADSGQTGQREWIFNFFAGVVRPHLVSEVEEKVLTVACGGFHTAAVTCCGKVYTLGKQDFGMLGTTNGSAGAVNLVDSLLDKNVIGVSCGGWHTLMWTDDGELYVCGKGEYGRLGLGHEKSICEPSLVCVGGGQRVRAASAGGSHSLILTTTDGVYATGRTGDGRLSIGEVNGDRVLEPIKVIYGDHIIREDGDESEDVLQVSAGGVHSFVLKRGKN